MTQDPFVRPTSEDDICEVMAIYEHARNKMRETGNMTQWVNGYPSREIIIRDIAAGNSFVIESGDCLAGVFTFIVGDDPTYAVIEGEWPDNNPYGTIHRIAAAPDSKGVADIALDFCRKKGVNIRVDTHSDNAPMLGWIAKKGFRYCGIITIADGTPRMAFQLTLI